MDHKWQALCFAVAIVLWVVAAFPALRARSPFKTVDFIPLGLAVFAVPFLWNAAVAGW